MTAYPLPVSMRSIHWYDSYTQDLEYTSDLFQTMFQMDIFKNGALWIFFFQLKKL